MPFLKNIIIDDQTKIKIWKVTLGELSHNELNNEDKKLLKKKRSGLLREQFLATRKVLSLENPDHEITYDINGKPLINSKYNISISHSHKIAAIAISDNSIIGLDVQLKRYQYGLDVSNEVVQRKATYAVGGSDLIVDISNGLKLK